MEQRFPELSDADLARMRPFGEVHPFADGTRILSAGAATVGMVVILKGQIDLSQRDGMGRVLPLRRSGPG